jgi:hypothetical protein
LDAGSSSTNIAWAHQFFFLYSREKEQDIVVKQRRHFTQTETKDDSTVLPVTGLAIGDPHRPIQRAKGQRRESKNTKETDKFITVSF